MTKTSSDILDGIEKQVFGSVRHSAFANTAATQNEEEDLVGPQNLSGSVGRAARETARKLKRDHMTPSVQHV